MYLYKNQLGKFSTSGVGEHVEHLDCIHLAVWFNLPMMLHQFSKSQLMAEDYRGFNTLHAAVGIPSCLAVMDCLLCKIDVNSLNRWGDTALHIAISKSAKSPTIIQRLVKAGANVNVEDASGRTPLHLILMLTESEHTLSSISALLQSDKVDINARDAFLRTPLHLASAAPAYIFKRRFTGPECQGSSAKEHKQILGILMERGADIESRDDANETPLHVAAKNANAFAVKLLLQRGASIIACNDHCDTPIHLAIGHMTPDSSLIRFPLQESDDQALTIEYLLDRGSNVNATNQSNQTPLHIAACFRCELTIFNDLVQHGAVVDATNNDNATPLHLAVKMGPVLNANKVEGRWRISWVASRQIIQFLIKNGEDSRMLREVADKVCQTLRSYHPNIVTRRFEDPPSGMDCEPVEPERPQTTWVKDVSNLLRSRGASINPEETSRVYGTLRFAIESWASWISKYHWMLAESQDKDDTSLAAAYVAWSEIAKLLS